MNLWGLPTVELKREIAFKVGIGFELKNRTVIWQPCFLVQRIVLF
jgi:hypothetical protein